MLATRSDIQRLEPQRRTIGFARIEAFREKAKAMRTAMYAIIAPLPNGAPSPRSFWYDLTREERTRIIALDDDVAMCRVALLEAQKAGVLDEVRPLVRAYFAAQADAALSGFEVNDALRFPVIAAETIKELGEANAAIARYAAEPTPANQHTARIECAEGFDRLKAVMHSVGHAS